MRALCEALRFLSILPIPGRPPLRASRTLAAYPWAGLVLGLIASACGWAAAMIFGAWGTAAVVVTVRIVLSGGLHMDGLADFADGLGVPRSAEERLRIMADSRLGTFGVLALIILVLLQTAVIAQGLTLTPPSGKIIGPLPLFTLFPILLAPALSRGLIVLVMRLFPTPPSSGLGERIRQSATPGALVFVLTSSLFISVFFAGTAGLMVFCFAACMMLLGGRIIAGQLGGLNGDAYGALIEIGDLTVLFGFLIIQRLSIHTPGIVDFIL